MISLLNRFPLVLLAAGKSSRMGQAKGLMTYQNRPWVLEQINRFARAGGEQIHLVLGHEVKPYFEQVPLLRSSKRINAVINPQPDLGMFSSLQAALKEIDLKRMEAIFVSPIDVPLPEPVTWYILLQAFHSNPSAIKACVPYFDGKGGHPVLLRSDWAAELLKLDPQSEYSRLDLCLNRLAKNECFRVQVPDPSVIKNINTPEAFTQEL